MVTGSCCSSGSDEKLKENIVDIDRGSVLARLMQLRPTTFTYKQTAEYAAMNLSPGTQYGLIAQEVEAIFPEFVHDHVHPALLDEDGKTVGEPISYMGMNYVALIPLLLAAIQEQQAEIEALQSALSANGIEVGR